ncbi:MAG: peptide deformylase [Polyangiaceae bacterium]
MALRKIATIGNPVLRAPTRELTREELASPATQRLIDDLIETMFDANGAGIAANQIHESVRICTICVKDNPRYPYKPNIPLTVLVNPRITFLTEETFLNYEGCLSVPNLRGEVRRVVHVRVEAWDREGRALDYEVKGLSAGTFQHEVDHLDGKLFVDRVEETQSLCTWADFDRFHKDAFVVRAKELVARFGQ